MAERVTFWSPTEVRRVVDLLKRITFPDLHFQVQESHEDTTIAHVDVRAWGWKADLQKDFTHLERQNGRWWRLSRHMTDGEVIQTAFLAVVAFQEHEAREAFKVDGLPVLQPHWSLDALISMAQDHRNTQGRETPR